ncbi:hypothetical protein JTB14_010817 [Gonioctena quinquepunctata]|nr:hypothetical protein JTB14_010817 [Gonioctena quinquepunctata]
MSPGRAERYREAFIEMGDTKLGTMAGEEALSMIIEAKLSIHQYEVIRCEDKKRFPSYKIVQNAKKLSYPEKESITITED